MKHQLKPNTYTICESPEQCKELFEWAKDNGVFNSYYYHKDENALIFEEVLFTLCEDEIHSSDGLELVPLTEFISRLKSEWVEGKGI